MRSAEEKKSRREEERAEEQRRKSGLEQKSREWSEEKNSRAGEVQRGCSEVGRADEKNGRGCG